MASGAWSDIAAGIEILGEVPADWDVVQLGRIGRIQKCSGGTKEDARPDGVACVRYGDIYTRHRFFVTRSASFIAPEDLSQYTSTKRGDVLFAASGETIEEIGKSVEVLLEEPSCCGGDILRFRPSVAVAPGFLGYAADAFQSQLQKSKMGRGVTVMHIYEDQLKYLWIAVPPLEEQERIVRFLHDANRRIRLVVDRKRDLIRALSERESAVVDDLVLRGLNPRSTTRESGVAWLGRVPESWRTLRAKYLFREIDERSPAGEETHLSMSQRLGLVPTDMVGKRTLVSESYAGGKLCREGDLVLNRLKAHLGVFAIAELAGVISPDYTVLRPIVDMDTRYFERVLRSQACRGELRVRAKGIVEGFWRLYTDDFYDIRLPVPPTEEQTEIVRALEGHALTTDAAIRQAEAEIRLVQEYQARLIADAVLGRVDPRKAPALPDEVRMDSFLAGLFDSVAETDADDESAALEEVAEA